VIELLVAEDDAGDESVALEARFPGRVADGLPDVNAELRQNDAQLRVSASRGRD
jgi:hypothetical protein